MRLKNEPESFGGSFERRERGRRYRIAAAVTFCWQTSSGEWRQGNGISRDISSYGISVISSSVPIPSAPIELTVNLPVPWSRSACLRGRGLVVRLLPEAGSPWGFAASINFDEEVNDEDTNEAETTESSGTGTTGGHAISAHPMIDAWSRSRFAAGDESFRSYRLGSMF